jgi:(p)ppGpp synthase/HD superfamily hydrolase
MNMKENIKEDLATYAKEYAIKCHTETNHLYDGKPYSVHLEMVCDVALEFSDLIPDGWCVKVLAACWLHDVIEDCRKTYNDIKKEFGEIVADMVYALSNEKGKTRKDRANAKYYQGIKDTPMATFVKVCDRIANIKYSRQTNSSMLEVYRKENENFKNELWSLALTPLFEELETELNRSNLPYTPYTK